MFRRPSIISDITTLRNSATSIPHDSHSSSSAMDQITPPTDRPLTPAEITTLQLTIRATLKLNNCSCALQAEEDATDLINYALDLISDGLSVGGIIEELEYMELEICGAGSLEEMRVALATSFVELEGQDRSVFASRPQDQDDAGNDTSDNSAYGRRNSYQSRLRGSENHVTVDLSAKTAAAKKRQELASLSAQSSMSLKDRMKMFAEDGTLRGSYRNPCSGGVFNGDHDDEYYGDELFEFEEMDQEAFESQRQRDLTEIMNNVALSEREQTNKMKEVRAKYGVAEMKRKVARASHAKNSDTANTKDNNNYTNTMISKKETVPRAEREMRKGRRSSVDLSAKSAVVKKCAELASLRRLGSSLKDRMGSMYSDDGNLKSSFVNNCNDDDDILKEEVEKKKSVDELRREELFAVMRDKTLGREEKIQKMDEVRAKYAVTEAETDDNASGASQSSDAPSSQQQQQQHAPGQARKEYMEEKRRKELQVIMRDRSLSKSMRKSKMDAVNTKYSSNNTTTTSSSFEPQGTPSIIEKEQQHQDSPGSDEDGTVETAASSKVSVDFSAKSYADRRRASLESLENSISSNDSDAINNGNGNGNGEGRVKVMSLRERMSMYQNNEFVVKV